jgi:hypothetical protein
MPLGSNVYKQLNDHHSNTSDAMHTYLFHPHPGTHNSVQLQKLHFLVEELHTTLLVLNVEMIYRSNS